MSKILGIDYGTKRIGLALSDESRTIATPCKVLERNKEIPDTIFSWCQENGVTEVVMGESKDLDGTPNPLLEHIHALKGVLEEKGLTVHLEPEFFTSQEAERYQKKDDMLDARAAALILQRFLDKLQHNK